ncbi:hypothetical protein [Sinobaca sp. H24]|uniref:hypothetical protein n=1 Tax=Sinobaca sp. H24 TaxID=2923376 RepID=UPI002079BFC2|nr:hypothetical protein [Sinobaca sp. H24]
MSDYNQAHESEKTSARPIENRREQAEACSFLHHLLSLIKELYNNKIKEGLGILLYT